MTLENVEKRARKMMDENGLQDWSFHFDRGTTRLGACYSGLKKITISKQLAMNNPWKQIRETMLHEIAHALTPAYMGHNRIWRETYTKLGGAETRDYSVIKMPALKAIGHCPNCKRKVQARRKSAVACGTCCKEFNRSRYSDKYKIVWR